MPSNTAEPVNIIGGIDPSG
uniref:Uncharacterized protein n=1 Tax=Anguilla anguilla TaxID=7936 RepID=A0A0E9SR27_ANGAN